MACWTACCWAKPQSCIRRVVSMEFTRSRCLSPLLHSRGSELVAEPQCVSMRRRTLGAVRLRRSNLLENLIGRQPGCHAAAVFVAQPIANSVVFHPGLYRLFGPLDSSIGAQYQHLRLVRAETA